MPDPISLIALGRPVRMTAGPAPRPVALDTRTYLPPPGSRGSAPGSFIRQRRAGARAGRDLQAETGGPVTLSSPNDLSMQIVASVDNAAAAISDEAARGLCVSIFGSAIGAAYLSTLSENEVRRLVGRAYIAEREVAGVMAAIARVRHDGAADATKAGGRRWSIAATLLPAASLFR